MRDLSNGPLDFCCLYMYRCFAYSGNCRTKTQHTRNSKKVSKRKTCHSLTLYSTLSINAQHKEVLALVHTTLTHRLVGHMHKAIHSQHTCSGSRNNISGCSKWPDCQEIRKVQHADSPPQITGGTEKALSDTTTNLDFLLLEE